MADASPAGQRKSLMLGVAMSLIGAAAIWGAIYAALPPLGCAGLGYALQWIAAATLFALVPGIEAIAHERLFTAAIDPLAGADSPRMKINQRYLQNTLEQWAVFVPGMLLFAYIADGRAIIAAAAVWTAGRWVFWIGYHIAPRFRAAGLVGMVQSQLILLYVVAHFAWSIAGVPGAAAVVALFAGVEAVLVWLAMHPGLEK
jgi:hypothetical protein